MGRKKSSGFDSDGIESLAKDKPFVYILENDKGKNIYTGSAKYGRGEERLKEHLPGAKDEIKGAVKVRIIQKQSIDLAQRTESKIIKRLQPSQNKIGK